MRNSTKVELKLQLSEHGSMSESDDLIHFEMIMIFYLAIHFVLINLSLYSNLCFPT